MLISHLFEYIRHFTKDSKVSVPSLMMPFYAFCWEIGNYIFLSEGNNISICVYGFCNFDDAEKIMSLPYEDAVREYYLVLLRKQIRGEVVIPDIVCGNIVNAVRSKNFAVGKWKELGAKKVLYHKAKMNKFYQISI